MFDLSYFYNLNQIKLFQQAWIVIWQNMYKYVHYQN